MTQLPQLPDDAPEGDALEQATPSNPSDDGEEVQPPTLDPETVVPPASEWDRLEQSVPAPLDDQDED